jgi:integrase/recombinase XerD
MRNCSQRTVDGWRYILNRFIDWCDERGLDCLSQITAEHIAAYRRSLFHYRIPKTGAPLKFETQAHYLIPVRRWFAWLLESRFVEVDPTLGIELPKAEHRLPMSIMTADQVEELLNVPDVNTPLGLRDRAILETFYSTAIRCGELASLDVYDVSRERGVVTVRQGKGRKDRVVPIGERCLTWIQKWTADVRPDLVGGSSPNDDQAYYESSVSASSAQALFVSKNGRRLGENYLSNLVRRYLVQVGVTQRGACHLLRHTAATLMMEHGADLRSLQLYLGHARLTTTQIYTHVSIERLKDVHRKTHPAKPNERPVDPLNDQSANGQPANGQSNDPPIDR